LARLLWAEVVDGEAYEEPPVLEFDAVPDRAVLACALSSTVSWGLCDPDDCELGADDVCGFTAWVFWTLSAVPLVTGLIMDCFVLLTLLSVGGEGNFVEDCEGGLDPDSLVLRFWFTSGSRLSFAFLCR
jgi:hypothetical protein